MTLSMRKAEKRDINVLCSLMDEMSHAAITREQMLNRLQMVETSQIDSLYVCEKDDKIVGLLGFRIRENLEEESRFGEVSAIVVEPGNRLKGAGRFIMDYAEKLAREKGCKGMWLVSGFGREAEAHKFYRRLGFKTTGYRFVKLFNQNNSIGRRSI
jgi:N-acetylglutamate synthase-like GNAT family acetyltransferase